MVDVLIGGQTVNLYCDGWLNTKIQKWLKLLKKDDDLVVCVDGPERSGKSVFSMQLAIMLDPNFKIENICMNANEFKKRIKEANRGDCIIYDEAFTGLSSKGALTEINKILVELMMEMGQKNLKVIITLPTFFMLEKYVALFRARCLFHVFKKRGQRGYWRYYGKNKKKLLYLIGKKFFSYSQPKSQRKGRFMNIYTVDENAYREKKNSAFQNKDRSGREERQKLQRTILCWYLTKKLGITMEMLSDMFYFFDLELDPGNVSREIKALEAKILAEIENPPDDTFITRLVKIIQARNEPAMRETRRIQLEKRAEAEIEREKRLLIKKNKALKPQLSKTEVYSTDLSQTESV